jgi:thermostable 8-oxoguanine DNA glycosylase
MSQQAIVKLGSSGDECLILPEAHAPVAGNLVWGRADVLFTPAFWASQVFLSAAERGSGQTQRFGSNFREEVVACLLCTHGLPSEIGLAAYERLRQDRLLLPESANSAQIERTLRQPVSVNGRVVRYRFPRQKARAVFEAVQRTGVEPPSREPLALRAFLQTLYGIGPKVASWITRNYLSTEEVAVIDVHVHRAGVETGFFASTSSVQRGYLQLERAFLMFAKAIGVLPSRLDDVMWQTMRVAPRLRNT